MRGREEEEEGGRDAGRRGERRTGGTGHEIISTKSAVIEHLSQNHDPERWTCVYLHYG